MRVKTPRDVKAQETRRALVAQARELFSSHAYADVSLDQLVQRTKVTKGALYHHFENKQEVYRAVVEAMEQDLVDRLETAAKKTTEPAAKLRSYCRAYLDAALDNRLARVLVIEAPVILGWKTWCDISQSYEIAAFSKRIAELSAPGLPNPQAAETFAQVLLGALNTGARVISTANDPASARAQVEDTIDRLLVGFGLPAATPNSKSRAR